MYNDKLKVSNKIISYDALFEIFSMMNEKMKHYKKIFNNEEMKNKTLDYRYQKWTFKDNNSALIFDVGFYDNTSIKFDNYNNFITIFNGRLDDIKRIYVYFKLSYSMTTFDGKNVYYSQYINLHIYETKMEIDISLSSEDKKIDDIYDLLKNKILNAPVKYDDVIKKKSSISNTIDLAIGFIPALVITTLLLFVPSIRYAFATSYVLYPVCCLFLAYFLGNILGTTRLDSLYENITPKQIYAGYDSNKRKSIYKDDIDKYIETSEILIGKNADNLKCRKEIIEYYDKYKKYIPYEFLVLLLLSIIVLFLS